MTILHEDKVLARPIDGPAIDGAIAIVGAACRLPGAPDLDSLARLLLSGTDAVTEIPDWRWSKARLLHPERGQPGKSYTFAAGVIEDVKGFDPGFFGISPREAVQMDPQQRLALELAYEALEDGGIDVATLAGQAVGVYVGGSAWDYTTRHSGDPSVMDAYSMVGATLCSIANRVSYAFDLRGPSFTLDTACSSSLVALHQAAEAIRSGQVPMALVGGVSLLLTPQSYVGFSAASMLSPRGRCHAFDSRADGYVRAEGGGFVFLKRLADAVRDGDPIRAVLRGTGVNSDGRTTGFSLPNKEAQAALLEDVYRRFGLDPEQLSYVEAHGTGTPAGDPIEAGALGRVLGARRSRPLPIGSVKTNVGHLEAASGMAGLMKALLVIEGGVIPPSLNLVEPNPDIPFAELNVALVRTPTPVAETGSPRMVGLNSFGFGGTNAHAVLEGWTPSTPADTGEEAALPPLLLSAQSDAALRALAADWRARLAGATPGAAAALVRGAARHRPQHKRRLVVPGGDAAATIAALDAHLAGRKAPGVAADTAVAGRVAFAFSGNGSQWAGMAADAMARSPAFRKALARVDTVLAPHLGWSVADALATPDEAALRRTEIAQPLLFAVQVALVEGLAAHGVTAQAMLGHSVGEVAAAWASGALTLDQAARVIAARSQCQQARHGIGGMAVLGLDAEAAQVFLDGAALADAGVEVAAHNSAQATTVAGPDDGLARLEAEARAKGVRFTRLDLDYAFHSAAMDPIADRLAQALDGLAPGAARLPFVSTVTGDVLDGAALDADYWWRNVRAPVRFAEGARAAVAAGTRIFLEIGPHPVVRAYLSEALAAGDADGRVIPTLQRRPAAGDPLAAIAAAAHAAGCDIRGSDAFAGPAMAQGLPRYPWQREDYWLGRTVEASDTLLTADAHPLLGVARGGEAADWSRPVSLETLPWVADHAVGGAAVMPAAALIDAALAAARARFPAAPAVELLDVEIGRALVLEAGQMRELRLRAGSPAGDFELMSRPRLSEDPWVVHVRGRMAAPDVAPVPEPAGEAVPAGRMAADDLYATARDMGLDYGPLFRTVTALDLLDGDAARAMLATDSPLDGGFLMPPNLVDGALQGLLGLAAGLLGADVGMLPWRFGRVRLTQVAGGTPATARLRVTRVGPRSVRADIVLEDAAGSELALLEECWFVRVALGQARGDTPFFHPALVPGVDPDALAVPVDTAALLGGDDEGEADSALLADALAGAAALAAARAIVPSGVSTLRPRQLARTGRIAPGGEAVLDRLLGWLEADGLATRDGAGGWTLAAGDEAMPVDAIWRTLFAEQPAAIAETALAALAAGALPQVAAQGLAVAPALAPALWQQLLEASPAAIRGGQELGAAIARLADGWPAGRPLRVLEIGARRGGFTARLAAAMPQGTIVAATGTDDLPALAERLERVPGARAIGWTPGEPLADGPFDLIVGVHALTLDGIDPAVLRDALAPGGTLLLAEPAGGRLWPLLRPDLTVREPAERAAALKAAGFEGVATRMLATELWPVALIAATAAVRAVPASAPDGTVLLFGDDRGISAMEARPLAALADVVGGWRAGAPVPAGLSLVVRLPSDRARLAEGLAAIATLSGVPAGDDPVPVTFVVDGAAAGDPVAAAYMGARRVLANEAPQLASRLIRLDGAAPGAAARAILSPDAEQEVTLAAGGRQVARVRRGLPVVAETGAGDVRLAVARPGLLDSLSWVVAEPAMPGAGEVAIRIEAAGLNFRDVMWAMGLLPDEALLDGFAGATLGLECAGIVETVGPDVTVFAVGDRVMAFAPAALGTRTVTKAHAVMAMPDAMGFAAAATVPVAFLTVAYALGECARLSAGETVLIHGGAGGVGLAAIQYARMKGARVFATAGSPAKRALLAGLGVEAVLDSRSLAFADQVRRLTGGEGVDVVLNSLAGEAMRRSLALVKPFGRFLELGKRDFYENTGIGLRPFRHNVTYYGIDADQLPLKRPALAASLFADLSRLFADGALVPLPHRLFDANDVEGAFRLMQGSGHIGKIVLTPHGAQAAPAVPAFAADAGTYVVTGGLDGFGHQAARWLAAHGARAIALLGRRGADTPGAGERLAALAADGVDARAWACDVADEAALAATLDAIRRAQGPIAGVVHAAVAMDDALLGQLDADRFARALAPKLAGAEALDRLTRDDPVSLFVLFSSVTTPLGNPGQGNYVAANAAIEAVAEARHAAGLPALAVQWGPIGDVGYLSREADVSDLLARQLGGSHLGAQQALDALPALLAAGVPVAGVAAVRWAAMKGRLPLLASPLFAEMDGPAQEEAGEVDLAALLADASPEEARITVTGLLVEEVARIMKLAPERIEAERPLTELGMDSLMAVELRLAVEQRFGVNVPLLALSEGATLSAMAGRIVRGLATGPQTSSEQDRLVERLARVEGGGPEGPADGAERPTEPGFAAAAAVVP